MTKSAQRILAISLFLLISALSCLFPLRVWLKKEARAQMRAEIRNGEAGPGKWIPASAIAAAAWEEQGEFRLNGRQYDVTDTQYRGGKKYYHCIADSREDRAEQKAADITANLLGQSKGDRSEKLSRSLADWLSGLYCEPLPSWSLMTGQRTAMSHIARLEPVPASPPLRRDAPPPEA